MGGAVQAQKLVKTYPNGVRALRNLTFTVDVATIFGLLGPNGAGKSTTVKILTTLSHPDSGEGTVAGFDIRRQPDQVRRRIGVVTQKHSSDLNATGRENLMLHGQIHGLRRRELRQRVASLLDRFELTSAADRGVRGYSGGMRRRLDIAMGLVNEPQVLFLDEPTVGLDPEIRAFVWREITRLRDEEGIAILLTTHYLEEVDHLADRLAIVAGGRVIAEGTPGRLKGALRRDVVDVELVNSHSGSVAAELLKGMPGMDSVQTVDGRLRARVSNGATATPAMLAVLQEHNLGVVSITVSQPSLDDVYMHITGQSIMQKPASR